MLNLCRVAGMPRKRRGPRDVPPLRVSVEVYPEEEVLIRQAKADAALRDQTFREWMLAAIALRLETPEA
jgi:hypothetical protein